MHEKPGLGVILRDLQERTHLQPSQRRHSTLGYLTPHEYELGYGEISRLRCDRAGRPAPRTSTGASRNTGARAPESGRAGSTWPSRPGGGRIRTRLGNRSTLLGAGPLLIRGHSVFTHCSMASSSRSTARRAGRCLLRPSRSRRIVQVRGGVPHPRDFLDHLGYPGQRVHMPVGCPLAFGPAASIAATSAICSSDTRGNRPARPAPKHPQRLTLLPKDR